MKWKCKDDGKQAELSELQAELRGLVNAGNKSGSFINFASNLDNSQSAAGACGSLGWFWKTRVMGLELVILSQVPDCLMGM